MMTPAEIRHRGYIWRNAWADLRFRYAGSIGGALWAVLHPLALIAVFTVIFTRIMQRPGAGEAPYVLYLCSALLPWFAFADCLSRATHAFVAHAHLLRKTAIPEQVFVAQGAVTAALSLVINIAVLFVLAAAFGHPPSWHWLLIPVPLLMLLVLAYGIGLALGTLHAFIRDVGQVVPVLLQIGFWTYPIVYRAEDTPAWMQTLLPWNPVYPSLEAARSLFLENRVPAPEAWLAMTTWALLAVAIGSAILRKLRPELRDVI